MSADNWRVCPKCKKTAEAKKAHEKAAVQKAYGEVSIVEFLLIRNKAEAVVQLEDTLREDYFIGIDEKGKFHVDYTGCCDECGLKHEYHYSQQVLHV